MFDGILQAFSNLHRKTPPPYSQKQPHPFSKYQLPSQEESIEISLEDVEQKYPTVKNAFQHKMDTLQYYSIIKSMNYPEWKYAFISKYPTISRFPIDDDEKDIIISNVNKDLETIQHTSISAQNNIQSLQLSISHCLRYHVFEKYDALFHYGDNRKKILEFDLCSVNIKPIYNTNILKPNAYENLQHTINTTYYNIQEFKQSFERNKE